MQFRLSTLLLSFVVVAMAMATFHAWGILASIILLASIAWIRRGRSRGGRFLMAAGGWLFALFVVSAGTGDMHPAARGIQCANNLYQIGRALAVCQGRGNLSPRVTTDARGTPLHSWRTSILPYLDQQALFSVLKLSESWNSASNRKCVCEIATYVCPTANRRKGMRTTTNYLALVIPDQPWPPPQQIGGTKELNPVMVIEVASSGIEWMEPRDITLDEAVEAIAEGDDGLPTGHSRNRNVLLADGSVRHMPRTGPKELVRAALLGEPGKMDELEAYAAAQLGREDLLFLLSFAFLVVSVLIMVIRPREMPSRPLALPETGDAVIALGEAGDQTNS